MKTKYVGLLAIPLLAAAGCARFSTTQNDISYDEYGVVREVRTVTKAYTFLDGKAKLAELKTSQTDKTQTTTVGGLEQETSSLVLPTLAEAIAAGVAKGLKP